MILSMATIHISEADAVRDFAGLMAHVRLGAEVVIEFETRAVAVVRPAVPSGPGRLLSEVIAAAETRGSSALLDGSFAHDLEEVINSHREPLNPPAWD
jgi:antitoxin (DNA-binding transcriptional repressor) of toxin-antitoxin stability system